MKKNKKQGEFLEQLRKIPIVQVACEKTGISRNSVYRWRNEDEKFKKDFDEALAEGEALINDMSESQLLTLIKEKNWSAISFWLKHRNPRFTDKIEITTKKDLEELTPEQETIVRKALELATGENPSTSTNETVYAETDDSTGVSGNDDQGQKSESGDH